MENGLRQSHTHCSSAGRSVEMSSNPLVGAYGPARYPMLGPQHFLLEHRAKIRVGSLQREANVLSLQKSPYLVSELLNFDAGR